MKYKKRIHIAPVGFEVDRIVEPAVEYKADKVYLLVHDNKEEDKASPYIERVIQELKKHKIKSEKVLANWRDVESITKAARKLINDLKEDEIFVNISSGSKIHAIALDRTIMTLPDQSNITEFYAESKAYEGFKPGKKQLSVGVKETKEIPKRKMVLPKENSLETLIIIYESYKEWKTTRGGDQHEWKGITKKRLAIKLVTKNILPGDPKNVGPRELSALEKNIIQKLRDQWKYIETEKTGQSWYVRLTDHGMSFVNEMTP